MSPSSVKPGEIWEQEWTGRHIQIERVEEYFGQHVVTYRDLNTRRQGTLFAESLLKTYRRDQ